MNDRHAELMAGYLDGSLSPAEHGELLQALKRDPELFEALAAEIEIHRSLRFAAPGGPGDDERSADRILDYVRSPSDCTDFLKRVTERARDESSPEKKTSRRIPIHRRRAPARRSYGVPIAVAAGLFVGFLLVVSFASSRQPAPTARETRPKSEPHQAKQDPTPAPEPEARRPEPERRPQPVVPDRPKAPEEVPQSERRPEPTPAPAPVPPKPEELPAPSPSPNPAPAKTETKPVLALATLDRVEGQVNVLPLKVSAKPGRALLPGEGVETKGTTARAVLKFSDGTTVEVGGGATVRELRDREGAEEIGTWIDLSGQGFLAAQVVKQPQGRPLVIVTPHGEMRVLGTTLRVVVDPNWSRLEVTEGHVRLTRKADGKTVNVLSGHYAMAATTIVEPEPVSRAIPPEIVTVNFGPEEYKNRLPEGVLNDSGEEFDPKRGYGWKGPKVGRDVVQPFTDPATGQPMTWKAGRSPGWHEKTPGADPMKSSFLAAGSIAHTETWVMPLPNGKYLVTVCVGGTYWKQGPSHVVIEGVPVVNRAFTKAADHFEVRDASIEIKDGELTMVVGGFPGKTTDPSSDTILNYIVIKRPKAK